MSPPQIHEPTTGWLELEGERPVPNALHALMAAAGALISLGALVAAVELHGSSRFAAVVVAVVLGLLGYLVLAGPDPLMAPTGVVLVAVACGALPPLLLIDDTTSSFTGVFALMALLWTGAWLAPLTRGRPFLLGLALTGGWLFLLSLAEDDLGPGAGSSDTSTAAYLSLFVGAGLLVAAWAFDRRGRAAFATPFVAVGDLAAVVGALAVANDVGDTGGSLVVAAAGIALGWVGHAGRRRGTTWIGAGLVAGGVAGLVAALLNDDASAYAIGLAIVAGGSLLAAATIGIGRRTAVDAASNTASTTASATGSVTASTGSAVRVSPVEHGDRPPVGEWRPDPTGRHPLRWWDGTRWTEHVSDGHGHVSTDPDPRDG